MAQQRVNGGSGRRAGRRSQGSRRSSSGTSGRTLAALAVLVAVLAGGTYLFRHTSRSPDPSAIVSPGPPADRSSAPTAVPRTSSPASLTPGQVPLSPRTAQTHASAVPPSTAGPAPRSAPFGISEEVFEGGARLYAANCAGCHGRPGQNARGPAAAQFWDRKNAAGSQAISQPVGILYQSIAKGNLIQGMPSYGQRLTDTQLWDLALLLKSSNDDLPEPVLRLLHSTR